MRYVYQARFEPDPDGGLNVTFPDVPEAITCGDDEADALASAAEALGVALRGYAKMDKDLPQPATAAADALRPVAVPLGDALKLSLLDAFRRSGMTKADLAGRLEVDHKEVRRILDPDHPTKLPTMAAALAALGKRAVLEVADAA